MIHSIGETAGAIYRELEANGSATTAKLKKAVEADAFIVQAAIGWLAREEKITLAKKGKSVVVALR